MRGASGHGRAPLAPDALQYSASAPRLVGSEAARVYIVDELDEAAEVDFLVVEERAVAALRAVEIAPAAHGRGHPFHVLGVHGVVGRADGQRWDLDEREVSSAVPAGELTASSQFARSL